MHILAPNETAETYLYSIDQLRRDNPQVSFPKDPTDALLATYNVFPVITTKQPVYNPITQNLSEGTPTLTAGVWTQVWFVNDATSEEVEQRTLEMAQSVRAERDQKLQETDWIASRSYERGEPVPTNWAAYRQALRDVTLQNGFPYAVIWPTKE